MKPDYSIDNEVCLVTYNDSLDFEYCQRYRLIETEYLKTSHLFILDMQYVSFIDSAGIGALISVFRSINSRGKFLCLINLQNNLRKVFQISEIESLFPIFDSITEARSHFLY
ncbi:MAG: STAS domain-containing protein [Candidatus Cloacimonetes bacterium]|nr:STAS domain-containing protein [Candidatus Cloacimonadota bacterium]